MDFENEFTNENADQITIGVRNQMMQKTVKIVRFQQEAKKFVVQLVPLEIRGE